MATTFYDPPSSTDNSFQVWNGFNPPKLRMLWALRVGADFHTFVRDDCGVFSEPKVFKHSGRRGQSADTQGVMQYAIDIGCDDLVIDGLSGLVYFDLTNPDHTYMYKLTPRAKG